MLRLKRTPRHDQSDHAAVVRCFAVRVAIRRAGELSGHIHRDAAGDAHGVR
jgi:hypothetical protein